ncbi:major facilitator superfamily domain-containing protein [Syncephalis pseudoplumigaleata]|uniref:Major facilitator superfamily domain-containing protein n=1 Tax=Syncephalis pseudoplumigaleata TaxID=1712513 RepID=A0A4P9YR32_9FUNG|nr:major facilitator superfamily domain-containing protein [Syncephalis pseudoplumigaleata]|eukprot:RKP22296.1 major facilitator superfamily domain-containing protein [Syncephalis pseudoplumigaleata]
MDNNNSSVTVQNTTCYPAPNGPEHHAACIDEKSTSGSNAHSSDQGAYRLYKRRWMILIAIVLVNVTNAMIWITYSSIATIGAAYFNVSLTATNMLNLVFYVCYIVASIPSAFVIDRHGIRAGLTCGIVGNLAGGWLRYLAAVIPMSAHARYGVTMLGHVVAGIAQPFALNIPTKFAATWFAEDGRAIVNTVTTAANPVGIALGSVLVPLMVKGEEDLPLMLVVVAAIASAPLLLVPCLRSRPPTPACPPPPASTDTFLRGVLEALRSPGFWALTVLFGSLVGAFSALTGLLNNIVIPYGYSDDDAGIFGAATILAGLIGAGMVGVYIDRTGKHKQVARIMLPFTAATFIGCIFAVREDAYVVCVVVFALVGLTSFSLLPVGLELSVECTYPVPEASSTNILWMAGQLFALVIQLIMNVLRDDDGTPGNSWKPAGNMLHALILLAVVVFVCAAVFLAFYRAPMRRREAERLYHMRERASSSPERAHMKESIRVTSAADDGYERKSPAHSLF